MASNPSFFTPLVSFISTFRSTPELESALYAAAQNGDNAQIDRLIRQGVNVKAADKDGRTVLHCAAWHGKIETIDYLVQHGADVKAADKNGQTVLHVAVLHGRIEAIDYLVQHGADVKAADKNGNTVLHVAVLHGRIEAIDYLVQHGADVKAIDNSGRTALHVAARSGKIEAIDYLVRHGADVKATDKYGATVLHDAAQGGKIEAIDYLVQHGADVKVTDNLGRTALHDAAQGGKIEAINHLVSRYGADVKAADKNGTTVLHDAAGSGKIEIVEHLVSRYGLDVKATDKNGTTVLHGAAGSDKIEVIDYLVQHGADVKATDNFGKTVLHDAAGSGKIEAIDYLVQHGADVKATDNFGKTVLHDAAQSGKIEAIDYLVQHGADVKAADNNGTTVLHHAARSGKIEAINHLVSRYGLDVKAADKHGQTVLHHAAWSGKIEAIDYLVQHGADVKATDKDGQTALHHAAVGGKIEAIDHLVSRYKLDIRARNNWGETVFDIAARSHASNKEQVLAHLSQKYGLLATPKESAAKAEIPQKPQAATPVITIPGSKGIVPAGKAEVSQPAESSSKGKESEKQLADAEKVLIAAAAGKTKEAEERSLRIQRREMERKAKEAEQQEKEAQKKAAADRLAERIQEEEARAKIHIGQLKAFADEGNVEAQFSLGELLLLHERDYGGRMAYDYIRAAALQGHGIARLYLGLFYEFGLYVEASLPAALFFYERADMRLGLRHLILGVQCLLENKFATVPYLTAGELFDLALCAESDAELMAEGDKKRLQEINTQLRAFFKRIAFESNALSAHLLAAIIYMGGLLGAKKDPVQAEQFLQKIAESSHARLQYNIGVMYEMGIWVGQDYKRAARWYEVAANKGLRCAQASLSNLYRLGHLGEVDLVKANKWAQLAENNAEKAVNKLSLMAEPLPARKISDVMSRRAKRFLGLPEKLELARVTENVQTARALYDFEPERDDKLPLRENEIVYVWDLQGDWWLCENKARREGRVPRNYLELLPLETSSLQGRRLEDLPARAIKVKSHEIEIAQGQSELGRGGFGRVCEGKWLGVKVAVKQSHALYLDDNTKKEFEKEVEVMGTLRHPNIVQLLAYTEDTPTPWLVMEYMDRGTLYEYLGRRKEENKHIFLPFLVALGISSDIAKGLAYLHGIGLVHRDIKSENILIRVKDGNHFFAQIADFGLSSFCRDENSNTMSLKTLRSDMFMGTIEYMAPELLGKAPYRYSEKTDMFSYGVIKWELITHEKPYRSGQFPARRSMRYNGAIRKYVSGGSRLAIPEKAAPKGWWELTERCWSQKAEDRPKAKEALEELIDIREAFLRNGGKPDSESSSSYSSASSAQTGIPAKTSSSGPLPGMHPPIHSRNTSGRLAEFELENAEGGGDGFYAAVGLQMQKTNRAFLMGLTIAAGTSVEEVLEELIVGKVSAEREDREEAIYCLAERSNSIVAIIDTRYPQLGFHCYFTGCNGERQKSYDVIEVPARRPIIRLAYTGKEFLSVNAHPDLGVGGLRSAFNGEILGGYSLASSTTKLSNSRQAFTAQMSSSRTVSSSASDLLSRTLSSKGKEEVPRHSVSIARG